jgi:FMN phosphatase YigB (HAD superfamily)
LTWLSETENEIQGLPSTLSLRVTQTGSLAQWRPRRLMQNMTESREARRQVAKAVVFDLGGVLIDLHSEDAGRELIEKYGFLPQAFAELTRSSFESHPRSITELAMVGQIGTAEYLDSFLHKCSVKDLDGLRLNRLSVIGRERASVFAIVEKLKRAGFICGVLSNTIALHWDKLSSAREYPSLALFDQVFASHVIKCAKPEESSFLFVAAALNIPMSQCLLVDDTPLNVDRAKAAGWQALLFSDDAQLQRDLEDLLQYRNF